jgi:hypothetical protein
MRAWSASRAARRVPTLGEQRAARWGSVGSDRLSVVGCLACTDRIDGPEAARAGVGVMTDPLEMRGERMTRDAQRLNERRFLQHMSHPAHES